jgi:Zn-dependent peptidase ImmA (M78 family)
MEKMTKTVVIYSGRFQPFHKGHYAAYQKLVSKFGVNNVYIGTSNKTDNVKSPFNFNEKAKIITKMFGIPSNKIVQVSNPYAPKEVLSKFDKNTTAYIAAVGEKDADRLAGKYFKPYQGETTQGYDVAGYTYIIPPESNQISGTDVRNWLSSDNAEKLFLKAYPKFDKEIFKMITSKLIKEEFMKGYPSKSDVKRIQKKNDKIRSTSPTNGSYTYDPISEQILKIILEADEFIDEYFLEEEPNPIMDKEITYTAANGKKKKITVRGALRLPKGHEAHIQAKKLFGKDTVTDEPPKKQQTPNQPGQPVKKGDTAQGKVDAEPMGKSGQQPEGPPPEQKLKGSDLKSSAEDRVDKQNKSNDIKSALANEMKNLDKNEQEFLDKGEYRQGSKFMNSLKDGVEKASDTKVVKAIGHVLKHKSEMIEGAYDGVKALANGKKVGSVKNKETGEWDYSDEARKSQIHDMKHFAKEVALLVASVALGGGLAAGATAIAGGAGMGAAASAIGQGAIGAFTHGAGGFAAHLGKDAIKHVALESMGLSGKKAAAGGAGLAGVSMGLLEIRLLINEEMDNSKFIQNVVSKMAEKMKTFEMSDSQLLKSIKSYNKNKDFGDLVNEVSSVTVSNTADVPDGSFLKKRKKRILDSEKSEDWYKNGGYTQTDFPMADAIFGDDDAEERTITYTIKNLPTLTYVETDFIKEDINVDINKGDTVLMGKFKNKKVDVKNIGKDQHGMPTINGKQATTFRTMSEMPMSTLRQIDAYADTQLSPTDVVITARHFFDRLNDPRNGKEISSAELTGYFKRLGRNKKKFMEFLTKYQQIVAKDSRTNINIPFMLQANKIIAKTVMRKDNFMSSNPTYQFENKNPSTLKKSKGRIIGEFIKFATERLGLESLPNKIQLIKNESFPKAVKSFGGYNPETDSIFIYAGNNRNIVDILRTLAHELVHLKQRKDGRIGGIKDGDTGSDIENEANAAAGILLRDYGRRNANIYESINRPHTFPIGISENVGDLQKELISLYKKAFKMMPNSPAQLKVRAEIDKLTKQIDKLKKESIKEATASEVIKDLDKVKTDLLKKVDVLIAKKKKLYSNVDIESPMSADEKKLDKDIADLFSQINTLVLQKRSLKKESVNEGFKSEYKGNDGIIWKKGKTQGGVTNFTPYYKGHNIDTGGHNFGNEKELLKFIDDYIVSSQIYNKYRFESVNEALLLEGGAYGHMNHPFDISMNLTFGDLKKIINNALDGKLGVVREKTDGQALAISWKNGRLIAARNKGHLANGGENALDMNALASKFEGRGELSDAYNFAMRDLSAAISGLSEKERQSIFKDGSAFCNLEVIYPQNANVIPYGQSLLVFHNVVEYDEKGVAIGGVKGAESKLASMIKRTNAHVQSKYTLQGPPITKLPKDEKLSSQKGKFNGMLSKLQSEFGLADKDGIADYHYAWWMKFVNNSKKNFSELEKEGLARRWAFDNKSFGIKSITDEAAKKWADGVDKDAKDKIMKGNIRKFEDIFLGVGAEVLSFMSSVLTAQPDAALQSIKASLESSISDIRSGGSEAQIKRLEKELQRLNAIGGFDKLVPNEGLVFFYKGNTYKLTGTFAPLNQILGIFKFGR